MVDLVKTDEAAGLFMGPDELPDQLSVVRTDQLDQVLAALATVFADTSTPEAAAALTRLAGEPTVPVLTIGAQQIKGYSDVQWGQYLDAAGYPKQSQLPSNYRRPQPEPLVAVQSAVPGGTAQASAPAAGQGPAAASPAAASRPAEIPVQPPSGIRF